MRKALWTLNVGNYAPEITALTYPLFERYAKKIGADFGIIGEREYPEMPVVYEKLQLHTLGAGYDWNIYLDGDALINPDLFDITECLPKDTVCHYASDIASNRWRFDDYFRRDGRHISSCNWFTVASDWCLDLWRPLDDLSLLQALENIFPVTQERAAGITRDHLIDDYVLSRNIARFGLKFTTVKQIQEQRKDPAQYFCHLHMVSIAQKRATLLHQMQAWGLELPMQPKKAMSA